MMCKTCEATVRVFCSASFFSASMSDGGILMFIYFVLISLSMVVLDVAGLAPASTQFRV